MSVGGGGALRQSYWRLHFFLAALFILIKEGKCVFLAYVNLINK
jgi:hypothetical protein